MKITPKNILQHELIGLEVEVKKSTNIYQVGIKGIVINETMKMLIIKTSKGRKRIPKEGRTFLFILPSGEKVLVDGNALLGRPEDRLKRTTRKW